MKMDHLVPILRQRSPTRGMDEPWRTTLVVVRNTKSSYLHQIMIKFWMFNVWQFGSLTLSGCCIRSCCCSSCRRWGSCWCWGRRSLRRSSGRGWSLPRRTANPECWHSCMRRRASSFFRFVLCSLALSWYANMRLNRRLPNNKTCSVCNGDTHGFLILSVRISLSHSTRLS